MFRKNHHFTLSGNPERWNISQIKPISLDASTVLLNIKLSLLNFRSYWLLDDGFQDAYKLGEKVAAHLAGKHKPIYHPETDCGDHVVVINCKDVAMHGFDWKHTLYVFDKVNRFFSCGSNIKGSHPSSRIGKPSCDRRT